MVLLCVVIAAKRRQIQLREDMEEASGVIVRTLPERLKAEVKELMIEKVREEMELPEYFDYREEARLVPVRDQGSYGTCWAFASLTALETTLMPKEALNFSRDHLNFHNHYEFSTEEGGSYIMSVAYLTGWQGPVLEKQDPYGDNVSPDGLSPVKHVQGVRMPAYKDYQAIKQTVYLHGGVESSLYMDFNNPREDSDYYSKEYASYCYGGDNPPNHDVVIIGWDDNYPAENFNMEVLGDGAFICQNSWGRVFGEGGVFYVSYYDKHIGSYNVAYTEVEDTDNYDVLYQSDLCGWSGQLGYNSDIGYFANVYGATGDQELQAVGFYATGEDTEYRLAVVPDFKGIASLEALEYVQSGYLQYTGYYTIELEEPVSVKQGQKFAVIIQIRTPGVSYPIAVEFNSGGMEGAVVLEDGEGYISPNGRYWERVEETQKSNLCLKVYAKEALSQGNLQEAEEAS